MVGAPAGSAPRMKPRTQLSFLSIALFALWGRAGAEDLPPFVVPPSLLGRPAATVSPPAPAAARPAAQAVTRSAKTEVKADARPAARPDSRPASGRTTRMAPAAPARLTAPGATQISADKVFGRQDVDAVAEGSAVLLRDATRVEGDRLHYFELTDEVEATGQVRVSRGSDEMSGPQARLKVGQQVGVFESPEYSISRPGRPAPPGQELLPGQFTPRSQQPVTGHGAAEKLYLEGENQFRFTNATWTSCKPDRPDWYLQARELDLDYDANVGEARGGTMYFKGVPLGYLPWADFPLADQRRSGVLSPTFGTSNKVGFDLTVPYYFNLAPNYDDTLTFRYMGRRGAQLRNEARYMTPEYKGFSFLEYMPEDQVAGRSRYAGNLRHDHNFGGGWSGNLNFAGVSDPRYFIDLSSRLYLTSQTHLPREGRLTYGGGGWWTASGFVQSFQTLQDPKTSVKVTEPYKRLPQLTLTANRPELPGGATFLLSSEFVDFSHPTLTQGQRLTAYPQLALPLLREALPTASHPAAC